MHYHQSVTGRRWYALSSVGDREEGACIIISQGQGGGGMHYHQSVTGRRRYALSSVSDREEEVCIIISQ